MTKEFYTRSARPRFVVPILSQRTRKDGAPSEGGSMEGAPHAVLMVEGECMSRCEQKITEKQKGEDLFHGPMASIVVTT